MCLAVFHLPSIEPARPSAPFLVGAFPELGGTFFLQQAARGMPALHLVSAKFGIQTLSRGTFEISDTIEKFNWAGPLR